jgi:hypothetical protein
MSILTLAQYHAARKQIVTLAKNGSTASQSQTPTWVSTSIYQTGDPVAMSASGNTTTGVVPTSATAGAAAIEPFSGTGYVTGVDFVSDFAGRIVLYDRLFHAGSFSTAVGVTSLSSQPSYSSRVPGGTDFRGTQIWVECFVGSGGANASNTYRVQYTNQDGTPGQVTGTVQKQNNVMGWCVQLPLAAGDTGVQTIENFEVVSAASAPTVSVFVARPLWSGRVQFNGRSYSHWLDQTGMPQVFSDSCLCLMNSFDVTSPKHDVRVEIASS